MLGEPLIVTLTFVRSGKTYFSESLALTSFHNIAGENPVVDHTQSTRGCMRRNVDIVNETGIFLSLRNE